jgi:hypothetical protein
MPQPQPKLKRRTSSTEENRQADSEAEMARFELADVSGSFVDRHSSPRSTNTVYSLQQSNIVGYLPSSRCLLETFLTLCWHTSIIIIFVYNVLCSCYIY